MSLSWTSELREAFHAQVRATILDEWTAVREARELARRWTRHIPARAGDPSFADSLEHKVAGYNAALHAHCCRVLRAAKAADRWLDAHNPEAIVHEHPDLPLGEYVLLSRAGDRGVSVRCTVSPDHVAQSLRTRFPPCFTRDRHEWVEAPLQDCDGQSALASVPSADVLFIATMNNYLNPMIAVMEELGRRGVSAALLMPASGTAWPNASRVPRSINRISFEQLVDAEAAAILRREMHEAESDWSTLEPRFSREFDLRGVNLWPLVGEDVAAVYRWYVPHVRAYARLSDRLVRLSGARTVVCARLRRAAEITICSRVQRHGGRCVMLVHGHLGDTPDRVFDDGTFASADQVCVWGAAQKQQILARNDGTRAEQVVATGNPDWDQLAPAGPTHRAALRSRIAAQLSIDPNSCWVCHTTQPAASAQNAGVREAALAPAGVTLLVKPHPGDTSTTLGAFGDHPRQRIIGQGGPALHDLLRACDVAVTFSSTTNLESMLVGTPVVTAALPPVQDQARLVNLETFGLPLATSIDSLAAILGQAAASPDSFRRALEVPARVALESLVANALSHDATRRVCDLLESAPLALTA